MGRGFTKLQGQYLTFIAMYTKLHRRPPAEADIQAYFHCQLNEQGVVNCGTNARVNARCHSDRLATDSIPRRAAKSSFRCPSSVGKTPVRTRATPTVDGRRCTPGRRSSAPPSPGLPGTGRS